MEKQHMGLPKRVNDMTETNRTWINRIDEYHVQFSPRIEHCLLKMKSPLIVSIIEWKIIQQSKATTTY